MIGVCAQAQEVALPRATSFSLVSTEAFALLRNREVAIIECVRALERGEAETPQEKKRLAAKLLGQLREDSDESLEALCANITLLSLETSPADPLTPWASAAALSHIRSPRVSATVVRHLNRHLGRRELLLFAHVLWSIDDREVTLCRLEQYLSAERKELVRLEKQGSELSRNLVQVKEWLRDPEFVTKRENQP
jgi:hypothetical protein